MKYTVILLAIAFLGCSKTDSDLWTDATIEGLDLTQTTCSGGLIIKKTDQVRGYQWDFEKNPFGISPQDSLPIKIRMQY